MTMNTREIKLLMAARDVLQQDPAHVDLTDLEAAVGLFEREANGSIAPVKVVCQYGALDHEASSLELGPFTQGVVLDRGALKDVASGDTVAAFEVMSEELGERWYVPPTMHEGDEGLWFMRVFVQPA